MLNEEASIADVIKALQQQGLFNICVVDNGSSDHTPTIAANAGATVVVEPTKGYGQACWRGLQTPAAQAAEWILFCDGDGSDDLCDDRFGLPALLAKQDEYDFVLGNRRGTVVGRSHLTPVQNFGNWLATRLISLGWGYAYEDLGPLRLIRRQALDSLHMTDRGFGWTVEMQAKAAEQNLRTYEPPVNYFPRRGGRSKIAGTMRGSVTAGWVILSTLARLYWEKKGEPVWRRLADRVATPRFQQGLLWVIALLLILGSVLAAPYGDFLNDPQAVPLFWRGVGLMSLGFVGSWFLTSVSRPWFWLLLLVPRLVMLAMYPGDDIWRYLWEGHIQNAGFNPYVIAPDAEVLLPLRFDWWAEINHPHLPAIYPPVTQLGFRALAMVAPSVLLFKTAFVAADVAICGVLCDRFGYQSTILYAWNPLVIYSFAGGGHYDSWFLLPVVLAWLWWESAEEKSGEKSSKRLELGSALAVGVSVAVKWMSLPLIGFLLWQRRRQWPWAVGLLIVSVLPMCLAALPFCEGYVCPVVPADSPFVTYGRSAALIPQFVASVWPGSVKANWIFAVPLGAMVVWCGVRSRTLGQFAERYFIALMLLSPIIHAWYFTWLVPFAVASRNWGTRLVSLSVFVYFALPYGLALGQESWVLTGWQRWFLWTPFLVGLVISRKNYEPSP